MANADDTSDTFRTASSLSNALWIALILVVALIIGGFFWVSRFNVPPSASPANHATAPAQPESTTK